MGPSANIPLREPLTQTQIDDLERWLRSISSRLEGQQGDWWPFWVKDGHLIGLPTEDISAACSFGLAIEGVKTEQDYVGKNGVIDPEIRAEIEGQRAQAIIHLGYYPKETVSIYAGCNEKIDHRLLGHLALCLAKKYDGIIDMNGAITPPLRASGNHQQGSYPPPTLQEISTFVRSIPGRVYEMYYTIPPNRQWVSHWVDATFLRAWLQHPNFYMIK